MKRFHFQLEPLLMVRRAEERRRQQSVAELESERCGIEQRIRDVQDRILQGRSDMRASIRGRLDLDLLRAHARASIDATRSAERLVMQLAGVHQRLEKARQELREAMRSRRAVELLRERRWEEWRRDVRREEQFVLDDLAASGRKVSLDSDFDLSRVGPCTP